MSTTSNRRTLRLEEFLRLCDLDLRRARDGQIYAAMQQEALAGLRRMIGAAWHVNGNIVVERPSFEQFGEPLVVAEVANICRLAQPATRQVYDRCAVGDEDNWIVRWMLWAAFQAFDVV